LQIIVEEINTIDEEGTLKYSKEEVIKGKTILVGNCKFRKVRD